MANFAQTASAKTSIVPNVGDIMTSEAFQNVLNRGLDKAFMREFDRPAQGQMLVYEENTMFDTLNFGTYRRAGGLVPQNRDADDLPYRARGEGFTSSAQLYTYRLAMGLERRALETDSVGYARKMQTDLSAAGKLTVEYAIADLFNRGVEPTSAPILAEDGMYLIDSARPYAGAEVGTTWSNLETASAISQGALFTAMLNARAQKDENGELSPKQISKIVIRPQDEQALWEILNSDLRSENSLNNGNYMKGRFDYMVYDFLTDAAIYYFLEAPGSEKNEIKMYWSVKPEIKTWLDGDNPDVMKQRVRMVFGLYLGSMRCIRGGEVS